MPALRTTDFLLRGCRGYQVFSADGRVGFVVEVVDERGGTTVVVRVGRFFPHAVGVPADAVESVDPVRHRVVVAPLVDEPTADAALVETAVAV